jgi:myo-inositol catabolism protein IolC
VNGKTRIDTPLYVLAMDQRGWLLRAMFGRDAGLTSAELARVREVKGVIFEGVRLALERRGSSTGLAVLVDEMLGADVAVAAKDLGLTLSMPLERADQAVLELDYEDPDVLVDRFRPDLPKLLIRHNVVSPEAERRLQIDRLREVQDWAAQRGLPVLLELLVPATAGQLAAAGTDARYDEEVRPQLTQHAVREIRDGGIHPEFWKLEGMPSLEASRAVAERCRAGGVATGLLVLGRAAPEEQVRSWLMNAAGTGAYQGFAIGRTLWWSEVQDYLGGRLTAAGVARRVATNYLRFIEIFETSAPAPAMEVG